ncbi:hypothetical protein ABK040_003183 [Willaertia magna]
MKKFFNKYIAPGLDQSPVYNNPQTSSSERRSVNTYEPKDKLNSIIGDYSTLSPWSKFKFQLIQLLAEYNVFNHNIKQIYSIQKKYHVQDPYLRTATEIYHPKIKRSIGNRFKKWVKWSGISTLLIGAVLIPSFKKAYEIEKNRREMYILQKKTFIKEKEI